MAFVLFLDRARNESPMILSCTGHRPHRLGGYSLMVELRLQRLASTFLERLVPSKVLTGMALGWDTAVAHECRLAQIPYVAVLPFPTQSKRWSMHARDRYYDLLRTAEDIHVVQDDPPAAGDVAAFHARNCWMVDNSEHLLALWDGDATGGTYHCVLYALERARPITNVWKEWVA